MDSELFDSPHFEFSVSLSLFISPSISIFLYLYLYLPLSLSPTISISLYLYLSLSVRRFHFSLEERLLLYASKLLAAIASDTPWHKTGTKSL